MNHYSDLIGCVESAMREREPQDNEQTGLWIPYGSGQGGIPQSMPDQLIQDINGLGYQSSVERHQESHWTLKFPLQMGGLFVKSSSINRPVSYDTDDYRMTYALHVHRFAGEYGFMEDPGPLTREELVALRDFLSEVIQDSVS